MSEYKVVVGVDGSDASARAVQWCAAHARRLDAEIVVVHAIELPTFAAAGYPFLPVPALTTEQRDELRDEMTNDWCKALADADASYRLTLMEGPAAQVVLETAEKEDADLVVTGRRGRGGFAELVLGSTSHSLTHLCSRPLVIVP